MEHIAKPLGSLLNSRAFRDGMAGWEAVDRWAGVVGEEIASRSSAERFERGTLHVEVANSPWVQELSFLKHRIIRQLNREIGRNVIRDVRFTLRGGGPGHRRRS